MHWLGPYVIKEITDGGVVQLVKFNGDPFRGKVNGSWLEPYIGDSTRWLYEGSIVLALQAVERRRGTINYYARELHNVGTTRRRKVSQGPRHCKGSFAVAHVGWKVTVIVTIHDVMLGLRPNGAGGRHLRQTLWAIFGKICHQGRINGSDLGGTVKFKFKRRYKLQRTT